MSFCSVSSAAEFPVRWTGTPAVSGAGGTIASYWYIFYQVVCDTYGDEYDIEVVVSPTEEEAIDAISGADAVITYGHGSSDRLILRAGSKGGKKGGKKGENGDSLDATSAKKIADKRKANGKGKLDFILIFNCFVCGSEDFVREWSKLVDGILLGYTGWTVEPQGPFGIGIPKVHDPVHFDPRPGYPSGKPYRRGPRRVKD